MKKLIVTAALLIFVGCNAQLEKKWIGKNVENLTAEMGTPTEIKLDGLAKKIYIYTETIYKTPLTPEQTEQLAQTDELPNVKNKTKTTMFWVDRKGIISEVTQSVANN